MTGHYSLYIVTDTPEKAAQYFFSHGRDQVPAWTKIVSTIDEIAAIPDGARAVGVWFVPFDLRNERWVLRRWEVNIVGDHFEVLESIRAWQAKRAAVSEAPALKPAPAPAPSPAKPAMPKPPAPRWT